jgi:disulfide bond formation protein DsbB
MYLSLLAAAAMTLVVGSALGFEHLAGYIPCALCLKERIPYYVGVPLALAAAGAAALDRATAARMLSGGVMLLMAAGVVLGIYHSGIEWKWWEGPAGCSASVVLAPVGDLLAEMDRVHPPSCSDAAVRFLGLSFAGWNVIASIGCAAVAGLAFRHASSVSGEPNRPLRPKAASRS